MNECILEVTTKSGAKEKYVFSSSRRMKREYRKWIDFLNERSEVIANAYTMSNKLNCFTIELGSYSVVTVFLDNLESLYMGWSDVKGLDDPEEVKEPVSEE